MLESLLSPVGLDADDVDRSLLFELAFKLSLGEKPYPRGDGDGALLTAGLEVWLWAGRVPMGATPGAEVLD